MSSRKIEDIHPAARPAFVAMEGELNRKGIAFVRACTYRSPQEQEELYAQGRTKQGRIVTHARAGQSKHNFQADGKPASLAADYYPLINGKLADRKTKQELDLWMQLAEAGERHGLIWGGRWQEPKTDFPHFEFQIEEWKVTKNEQQAIIKKLYDQIENAENTIALSALTVQHCKNSVRELENLLKAKEQ